MSGRGAADKLFERRKEITPIELELLDLFVPANSLQGVIDIINRESLAKIVKWRFNQLKLIRARYDDIYKIAKTINCSRRNRHFKVMEEIKRKALEGATQYE